MADLHNDPSRARAFTRREFVGRGLLLASAAAVAPAFIQRSALAMTGASSLLTSLSGVPEDHVLVVVQLSGGNDGLNTVVPFADDNYYNARRAIGIPAADVLRLGSGARDDLGLHPALGGIKDLYDQGLVSVVQGVGYPNPNRSHFKSMDIWHTADTSGTGTGWLGRYVDAQCCGFGKGESGTREQTATSIAPPVAIGREAPLALQGGGVSPVGFETPDLFRWTGGDVDDKLLPPYDAITRREPAGHHDNPNAAFLTQTALDARIAGETIRKAVDARSLVEYPRSDLATQLSMVAKMIRAGMKTRVYYVTHGGFDTHAGQGGANGRHANLLRQYADAMNAFYRDLKAQGNDARVLSMTFSEFGRRVGQNASGGTDHGTAAPVFLFGPMVKPGVANPHPSLTDLDDGDLKFSVDFRRVYAAVLEDWMNADSATILEGRYAKAPVINA